MKGRKEESIRVRVSAELKQWILKESTAEYGEENVSHFCRQLLERAKNREYAKPDEDRQRAVKRVYSEKKPAGFHARRRGDVFSACGAGPFHPTIEMEGRG